MANPLTYGTYFDKDNKYEFQYDAGKFVIDTNGKKFSSYDFDEAITKAMKYNEMRDLNGEEFKRSIN